MWPNLVFIAQLRGHQQALQHGSMTIIKPLQKLPRFTSAPGDLLSILSLYGEALLSDAGSAVCLGAENDLFVAHTRPCWSSSERP